MISAGFARHTAARSHAEDGWHRVAHDRQPSLLKWAKDLAFASHLRSEPFGPVLQETVVVMTGLFGRFVKAYENEWADYDLAGLRSGHVVEVDCD